MGLKYLHFMGNFLSGMSKKLEKKESFQGLLLCMYIVYICNTILKLGLILP